MARSRHGRSRGGPSSADAGLPSWAQRHLEEAGDPAADIPRYSAPLTHRRPDPADESHRLRGWGVAIVSVAAAVGAVPLAITSLAHDHSDDPLPHVDTYTAGSPAPLGPDGGSAGGARHRAVTPAVPGSPGSDPSTAGVLAAPPAPPVGAAQIVPGRRVAAPAPAALIRASPTVPPNTTTKATTPRSATPTTTTTTSPGEGRTATPPKTKPQPAPRPQTPSSDNDGGSQRSGGPLSNTVGNTVSGVTGSLGL